MKNISNQMKFKIEQHTIININNIKIHLIDSILNSKNKNIISIQMLYKHTKNI